MVGLPTAEMKKKEEEEAPSDQCPGPSTPTHFHVWIYGWEEQWMNEWQQCTLIASTNRPSLPSFKRSQIHFVKPRMQATENFNLISIVIH